jgi:hypothetical protein
MSKYIPPVAIISSLDYLKPEINRPDLFEERTTLKSSIKKSGSSDSSVLITILTIIWSAFVFITLISIFTLLQTFFDKLVLGDSLTPLVESRFYYCITTIFVSIIASFFLWYVYQNNKTL